MIARSLVVADIRLLKLFQSMGNTLDHYAMFVVMKQRGGS
jgi:hypothetical protein